MNRRMPLSSTRPSALKAALQKSLFKAEKFVMLRRSMKKLLLCLLPGCLTLSMCAQTWQESYAGYGNLMVVKLDSAPFPHADRAKGHQYHDKFFSAETNYSDNHVAIFVPKNFHLTDKVDFVVHFHGWNNHIEKV